MSKAQINSAFRSVLKIGGSAATVLAIVNPAWGALAQLGLGALGTVGAGIGTLWGIFAA